MAIEVFVVYYYVTDGSIEDMRVVGVFSSLENAYAAVSSLPAHHQKRCDIERMRVNKAIDIGGL